MSPGAWEPATPGPPPGILVFGLGELLRARAFRPDAVLSLLSPGKEAPRFESAHLVLRMTDVEDDVPSAPAPAQARLVVAFLEAHRDAPRIVGEGKTLLQTIRRHPDRPPPFRQTAHPRLVAACTA